MNNLKELIRVQLKNLFFQSRGSKKGKKAGIGFMVLQMGLMVYLSVFYSLALYSSLPPAQYYLGIYMMSAAGALMILIIGVPYAQGFLFGFKDFDFLMSLPVRKQDVVASKISTFMILQYLYAGFFMIPAMIVYGNVSGQGAVFYLLMVLGFLSAPLVSIMISALIGLLMKNISSRMKNQTLVSTILNILFMAAIFFFSFRMNSQSDPTRLLARTLPLIKVWMPQIYWYVSGCIDGSLLPVLVSMAVSIGLFALFLYLSAPLVLKVSARSEQGYHVKNFRLHSERSQTLMRTLLKKEFGRLFSNTNYLMNMCFGIVMMIAVSVYALMNRSFLLVFLEQESFADAARIIPGLILLGIGFMGHSTCTTGVSISLEGKSFWILKTLPISIRQIFLSKGLVNFVIIIVPALFCLILLGIAFAFPWQDFLIGFVYLVLLAAFVSMYGLFINLCFPKLDFDRDIVVIKQSMASFLSIIGSMIMGIVVFFSYLSILSRQTQPEGTAILLILCGIYLFLDVLLYEYLEHEGAKTFRKLS